MSVAGITPSAHHLTRRRRVGSCHRPASLGRQIPDPEDGEGPVKEEGAGCSYSHPKQENEGNKGASRATCHKEGK